MAILVLSGVEALETEVAAIPARARANTKARTVNFIMKKLLEKVAN